MRNLLTIAFCALIALSCSKEKTLERHLKGTWNIDKFSNDEDFAFTDVGTVKFDKDGTGKYDMHYEVESGGVSFEVENDESFKWENGDKTVSITSDDGETIVWDVDDDSKKEQKWSYTDEDGTKWEMELTKK